MKTKDKVKKSSSRIVEEQSGVMPNPTPSPGGSPEHPGQLLDSSTTKSTEQSENVYENKRRGQKVKQSRS